MRRSTVILLLGFMIQVNLMGQLQYLDNLNEIQVLAEKVVQLFESNEIHQAVDELEPYWPLPENEISSFETQTVDYLILINERFGKSIGSSKLKTQKISDFAIRDTYLIRYEYMAIRLMFIFYKNDKGWIVNSFKWDDSFEEEFK